MNDIAGLKLVVVRKWTKKALGLGSSADRGEKVNILDMISSMMEFATPRLGNKVVVGCPYCRLLRLAYKRGKAKLLIFTVYILGIHIPIRVQLVGLGFIVTR